MFEVTGGMDSQFFINRLSAATSAKGQYFTHKNVDSVILSNPFQATRNIRISAYHQNID